MITTSNEYERAFESWLYENQIKYVAIDQSKRVKVSRDRIKSFDFLLYRPAHAGSLNRTKADLPDRSDVIIAEVKGRKFKGTSLASRTGFDSWVPVDDVKGLLNWEHTLDLQVGEVSEAIFVFAYKFANVDVETDGLEVYEFEDNKYMFYAIRIDDYVRSMKQRSPKWETVFLPADKFREHAIVIDEFLLGRKRAAV